MKFLKNYSYTFSSLILLSLIFSFNFFLEIVQLSENFLPFYYGLLDTGDNYFYYSFISDFKELSFNFFPHDQNNNKFSVYSTYFISLLTGAFPSIFTDDIRYIFFINNFLFHMINTFVIFFFLNSLIKEKKLSFFFTFLTLFFPVPYYFLNEIYKIIALYTLSYDGDYLCEINQLCRMPNVLITNIYFILYLFLFYNNLTKKIFFNKPTLIIAILCILSPFISLQLFIFIFVFNLIFIFTTLTKSKNKKFSICIFLSIIFIILFLLLNFYNNIIAVFDFHDQKKIILKEVFFYFLAFIALLVLTFFSKPNNCNFFYIYFFSIFIIFFSFYFIFGRDYAHRILFRGGDIFTTLSIYYLIFNYIKNKNLNFLNKNIYKYAFFSFILVTLIAISVNKYQYFNSQKAIHNDEINDFVDLYMWVNKNTELNDQYLTNDINLNYNLPAYTHLNPSLKSDLLSIQKYEKKMEIIYSKFIFFEYLLFKNFNQYLKEVVENENTLRVIKYNYNNDDIFNIKNSLTFLNDNYNFKSKDSNFLPYEDFKYIIVNKKIGELKLKFKVKFKTKFENKSFKIYENLKLMN
jgi:hypothetical protein